MFKNNNKTLIIVLFSLILFCTVILSSYITRKKMEINEINVILYSTSDKMDLLEYLKKENSGNFYIKKKVTVMILKDISLLALINPKIEELNGTPLEALYRVVEYSNKYGFNDDKDALITDLLGPIKPYMQKKSKKIIEEYEKYIKR